MAAIDLTKLNFGQFNPNLVKQTAAAQAAVGNPSPVQSSPSSLPAAPIDMSKVDFSPWRNAPTPIGVGQQAVIQQQTNPINPVQITPQARPQVPQITPQIQQTNPAAGMGNAQNYIDQLIAAQKSAQISALGKSRDNALSNLGAEKAGIQPKYQDARNQAAGGAQQQARNFAEYMANRGGSSSGANAQAQISNNMALQGSLGSLGRQETAAFTDIGRRETDVGNAFESDVVSAQAGLEADRMKALLSDYYIAQQRGDTLAQRNIENQMAQAQLQMQQQGQNFNQFDRNRTFEYGTGRDVVADTRYGDETKYNRGQDLITNNRNAASDQLNLRKQHIDEANYYSDKYGITVEPKENFQFVIDQVAGLPTVAQQTAQQKQISEQKKEAWDTVEMLGVVPDYLADIVGVPAGTPTQKAKEFALDAAYKNSQLSISQQNANTSAATQGNAATNSAQSRLMDIWQTSGFAPAGIPGVKEGTPIYEKPSTSAAEKPNDPFDKAMDQAISLAQKDLSYSTAKSQQEKQKIIDYYYDLIEPTSNELSDEDILKYLK